MNLEKRKKVEDDQILLRDTNYKSIQWVVQQFYIQSNLDFENFTLVFYFNKKCKLKNQSVFGFFWRGTVFGEGSQFLKKFFILKNFLLEYNCFTMLCQFLLHSEVNQLYSYTHPLPLGPPCPPPAIPPNQAITEHQAELPVLYSKLRELILIVTFLLKNHQFPTAYRIDSN